MKHALFKAQTQFHWSKTRDHTIESGWKPSGFGEGAWRESQQNDAA